MRGAVRTVGVSDKIAAKRLTAPERCMMLILRVDFGRRKEAKWKCIKEHDWYDAHCGYERAWGSGAKSFKYPRNLVEIFIYKKA